MMKKIGKKYNETKYRYILEESPKKIKIKKKVLIILIFYKKKIL